MRIVVSFLVCSLVVTQAFADGWTSIDGKNKNGDLVQWAFEYDPVDVSEDAHGHVMSAPITVTPKGSRAVVHKDQICTFSYDSPEFSCAKDGTTPLAGATYVITPDLRECGGKIYTLKRGTGGPKTPRKLYQPPWEC